MTVALENNEIKLSGPCRIEDAEPLYILLQADPARRVDLSQATDLHSAVVQVLLVVAPPIQGNPSENSALDWIVTCLRRG